MRRDLLGIISFFSKNQPIYFSQYNFEKQKIFYFVVHGNILYLFLSFLRYSSLLYPTISIELSNHSNLNSKNYFKITLLYLLFCYRFYSKLGILTTYLNSNNLRSSTNLFPGLTWSERETTEMWDINFSQKSDNRILLLDYGFIGFPLEKTYPVTGYKELFYEFSTSELLYTSINLEEDELILND